MDQLLLWRCDRAAGNFVSDSFLSQMVALIPKLRTYGLVLTRSDAEADDLVQETCLRAWRFREGFTDGTNMKAWLIRIMRNQYLDRANADRHIIEDVHGHHAAALVSLPTQELNLQYNEVLAGLRLLSEDTREAILLTAADGFTYSEAAQLCGCPVGTMKSRVNRAREFLTDYVDAGLEPTTMHRGSYTRLSAAAPSATG